MPDRENVIKGIRECLSHKPCSENGCPYEDECAVEQQNDPLLRDALALLNEQQQQIWELQDQVEYLTDKLKEQEKKQITLHKKHVITWGRDNEFSMRKLYEAICEILLDEGELFIVRTDDHEKVDFVFYVAEGR